MMPELRIKIALRLLVLLLAVGPVMAQSGNTQPRYQFTRYRLANGLRFVFAPDAAQTGLALHIAFDAGTKAERSNQVGAAEVLQNIMLEHLRQTGGASFAFDGTVNQERSSYVAGLSAAQLEPALARFAEQRLRPMMCAAWLRNTWPETNGR